MSTEAPAELSSYEKIGLYLEQKRDEIHSAAANNDVAAYNALTREWTSVAFQKISKLHSEATLHPSIQCKIGSEAEITADDIYRSATRHLWKPVAKIDNPSQETKESPLHTAIRSQAVNILKSAEPGTEEELEEKTKLITQDTDPAYKQRLLTSAFLKYSYNGLSIANTAAHIQDPHINNAVLDLDVHPDGFTKSSNIRTPLQTMIHNEDLENAEIFLERGANPNVRGSGLGSLLSDAVDRQIEKPAEDRNYAMISLLIKYGAIVDVSESRLIYNVHNTLLTKAVSAKDQKLFELLWQTSQAKPLQECMDMAKVVKMPELIEFLSQEFDGTSFQWAIMNRDPMALKKAAKQDPKSIDIDWALNALMKDQDIPSRWYNAKNWTFNDQEREEAGKIIAFLLQQGVDYRDFRGQTYTMKNQVFEIGKNAGILTDEDHENSIQKSIRGKIESELDKTAQELRL